MTGVGLAATGLVESEYIKEGKPEVLFSGMDYLGNICGVSNYTDINDENILNKPKTYVLSSGLNICIEFCPLEMDLTKFHCKYEVEAFIQEQSRTTEALHGEQAANSTRQSLYLYYTSIDECMPYVKTTNYLGYCVPNVVSESISEQMTSEFEMHNVTSSKNLTIARNGISGGEFFDETMADTYLARNVILAFGVGGAMILGFLFLMVLRLPGMFVLDQ